MTTLLTVTPHLSEHGDTVLRVAGDIDMTNTDVLTTAIHNTTGHIVIDLTDVNYLDSAGLAVLFAHADHIDIVANPVVAPILQVCGIAELATVHHLPPNSTEPLG